MIRMSVNGTSLKVFELISFSGFMLFISCWLRCSIGWWTACGDGMEVLRA